MNESEVPRCATSARILLTFAQSRRVDVAECLRGTGINTELLAGEGDELPTWQELRLIRNVVAALPSQGLGLQLGRCYHLAACGIAGLGLISAQDVSAGLAFAASYRRLFHGFCRVLPEPSGACLINSRVPGDLREFLLERDLALMMNAVVDSGAPPDLVRRIELTRPEPAEPDVFHSALGCEVHFGRSANRVVFDPTAMRAPLRQADPTTNQRCALQCEQRLTRSRAYNGMARQVRDLLLAQPAEMPGLPQVAAELLTTPRTLRRRLAEAGTSYRELLGEVRISLAQEMLESSQLTVEAIGERLGYSECTSFNRAFKCRTGVTPHFYRRQALRSRC